MNKFDIDASVETFQFGIKFSDGIKTFNAKYPTTTEIVNLQASVEEAESKKGIEQIDMIIAELSKLIAPEETKTFTEAAKKMTMKPLTALINALVSEFGGKE